jgi:hypothetical protein
MHPLPLLRHESDAVYVPSRDGSDAIEPYLKLCWTVNRVVVHAHPRDQAPSLRAARGGGYPPSRPCLAYVRARERTSSGSRRPDATGIGRRSRRPRGEGGRSGAPSTDFPSRGRLGTLAEGPCHLAFEGGRPSRGIPVGERAWRVLFQWTTALAHISIFLTRARARTRGRRGWVPRSLQGRHRGGASSRGTPTSVSGYSRSACTTDSSASGLAECGLRDDRFGVSEEVAEIVDSQAFQRSTRTASTGGVVDWKLDVPDARGAESGDDAL